jgi:hypothetical protein
VRCLVHGARRTAGCRSRGGACRSPGRRHDRRRILPHSTPWQQILEVLRAQRVSGRHAGQGSGSCLYDATQHLPRRRIFAEPGDPLVQYLRRIAPRSGQTRDLAVVGQRRPTLSLDMKGRACGACGAPRRHPAPSRCPQRRPPPPQTTPPRPLRSPAQRRQPPARREGEPSFQDI